MPVLVAGWALGVGSVALGYGIGKSLNDEPGGMTNAQLMKKLSGRPFPPRPQ